MSETSVLLCTAGYDHTVRFWEASTATPGKHVSFSNSQVNVLEISQDKRYIAVAGYQVVKIFQIHNDIPALHLTLNEHCGVAGNVTAVGFQKDCKWMFTASEDGSIRIWDVRSQVGKCQRVHTLRKKTSINTAVLHPNQGEIFIGDQSGFVRVWDLTSNKCSPWHQPEGRTAIRSLTIATDATYLVAANDRGSVYVYGKTKSKDEEKDEEGLQIVEISSSAPASAPASSLPSSSSGGVESKGLNDPSPEVHKGWRLLRRIKAHDTYITKVLLSPDAAYIATASADCSVKLFDVDDDFKQCKHLKGHSRWVWDIAFSADSAYLVSASSDKTAKLWDLARGTAILDYKRHTKALTCVALNDAPT